MVIDTELRIIEEGDCILNSIIEMKEREWTINHVTETCIQARLKGGFHGETVVYIQKDPRSLIQTEVHDKDIDPDYTNSDQRRVMKRDSAKSLLKHMLDNFTDPDYIEILMETQDIQDPT